MLEKCIVHVCLEKLTALKDYYFGNSPPFIAPLNLYLIHAVVSFTQTSFFCYVLLVYLHKRN